MNRILSGTVVLLISLLSCSVMAEVISEQDAVLRALKNHPLIERGEISLKIDSLAVERAESQYLPNLDLSGTVSITPLDTSEATFGPISTKESYQYRTAGGKAALTQAVPGGAEAKVELSGSIDKLLDSTVLRDQQKLLLSYEQPLVKDAFRNDPVRQQIRIQKVSEEKLTASEREKITDILSEVRNKYWNCVEASLMLDIYKRQKELSEKRHEKNLDLFSVGNLSRLDTLSSYIEYLKNSQDYRSAELSFEESLISLKSISAVDEDISDESISFDKVSFPESLSITPKLMKELHSTHPRFSLFQLMKEELLLQIEGNRNTLLPSVNFIAQLENSRSHPGFSDDTNFRRNALIGIIASYSIPDKSTRLTQKMNQFRIKELEKSLEEFENEISADIDKIDVSWQREIEALELSRERLRAASEQFEVAELSFDLGEIDFLRVKEALIEVENASVELLKQKLILKRIAVSLDRITGRVLTLSGVVVK